MPDNAAGPVPSVAIGIPAWNGARFLGAAIASALAQTHNNIRLFVVDDCSQDDTAAVAATYAPRVTLHRNRHRLGIGANWNRCISLARDADYLLIMHQDDLISPDLVKRALGLMAGDRRVDFVLSRVEQIDDQNRPIARLRDAESEAIKDDTVVPGKHWFERLMRGAMPMWGPVGGVARRSLYDRVGRFDESYTYALDLQMYFRMVLASDVGLLGGPVYRWRRHADQATARHHKGDRYAEVLRAKHFGCELAQGSGGFDKGALRRLRHALADDCCRAARRYALADPSYARRYLLEAWALRRTAVLTPDFISASLRRTWSSIFGPTAGGRKRYVRTDI